MKFDYVCDCHNDSILRIADGEYDSLISTYNMSQKHRFLQIFAIFNENGSGYTRESMAGNLGVERSDLYGAVLKLMDIFNDPSKSGSFDRCFGFRDICNSAKIGNNIGMLGLEGAGMIDSIEKLHEIYGRGVRFITLTWNPSNCIASGCSATGTSYDTGLTSYGKQFVKECGRLGIAVDLSHASQKTMRDVLEQSDCAVLATHSNFYSVCPHVRNLPDDVAEEIVRRGGFIGLNTYLPFVREGVDYDNYEPGFLFDHIDHALERGWHRNLGFGFDIDGIDGYALGITLDLSVHDQYLELLEHSVKYDGSLIYGLRCGNFMDFLERSF
ncbi:MAG: membrane dipeptidase [Clostridia bacterium]|nr:membrane dipeptidase [Clostridia bacterium]